MNLEEFYDYKNQLVGDLITNESIVKLLSDDCSTIKNPESLIYKQIFPFEFLPETVEHGRTFICCEVDIRSAENKTFLLPVLYVWEFTHKSLMVLPDGGGVRTDKLAAEIAKTINGSRFYGLGELGMYSARRFAPLLEYQGKQLTFRAKDFNRVTPTGKPVPSNRKYR